MGASATLDLSRGEQVLLIRGARPQETQLRNSAITDAIVSGFFSGSTRHEDRSDHQLWQHLRGQNISF